MREDFIASVSKEEDNNIDKLYDELLNVIYKHGLGMTHAAIMGTIEIVKADLLNIITKGENK